MIHEVGPDRGDRSIDGKGLRRTPEWRCRRGPQSHPADAAELSAER